MMLSMESCKHCGHNGEDHYMTCPSTGTKAGQHSTKYKDIECAICGLLLANHIIGCNNCKCGSYEI